MWLCKRERKVSLAGGFQESFLKEVVLKLRLDLEVGFQNTELGGGSTGCKKHARQDLGAGKLLGKYWGGMGKHEGHQLRVKKPSEKYMNAASCRILM